MSISRRIFIRGIMAAPAVIAASSLMPLRGIKFDPFIRLQSWRPGTQVYDAWGMEIVPLSKSALAEAKIRDLFGQCYYDNAPSPKDDRRLALTPACDLNPDLDYYPAQWDDGTPQFSMGIRQSERDVKERRLFRPVAERPRRPWSTPKQHAASTRAMIDRLSALTVWGA